MSRITSQEVIGMLYSFKPFHFQLIIFIELISPGKDQICLFISKMVKIATSRYRKTDSDRKKKRKDIL